MKAILHVDKQWGIGKKNGLMFSIPADMAFFRKTTLNKVVVMGSNTLLSFPNSKPLPKRTNIVLWPNGPKRDDCIIVESLEALFEEIKKYSPDDVYVIGGAMMYRTMLPYCSEVLLTKVDAIGGADVFFPNLDEMPEWEVASESEPEETNGIMIKFLTYRNKNIKNI